MAREPQQHNHVHRDRDPDQPEQDQPKRRYEHARDYLKLRRFRMDFGREFNATNYWTSASRNPAPPPRGDTGGVTRGRR